MNKLLIPLLALLPLAACNYDTSSWYRPQVTWTVAVEREDNTPLSPAEIAGHRVHWGYSSGNYPNTYWSDGIMDNFNIKSFSNPTVDLNRTVYMVITTVDTDGRESDYSNEVFQ